MIGGSNGGWVYEGSISGETISILLVVILFICVNHVEEGPVAGELEQRFGYLALASRKIDSQVEYPLQYSDA
jgi:hypothetical protein